MAERKPFEITTEELDEFNKRVAARHLEIDAEIDVLPRPHGIIVDWVRLAQLRQKRRGLQMTQLVVNMLARTVSTIEVSDSTDK